MILLMAKKELHFLVEGGKELKGSVTTSRSKNGAVALLAASLLNRGTTVLKKVPKIEEVKRLLEVLESIGVSIKKSGSDLIITPPAKLDLGKIDTESATRTRSILMFIGPLLHHFKDFDLPQSGGCTLGLRSVRPHLFALEKFGVFITAETSRFRISHDELKPAEVILYESSDTATINSLFAASRIEGVSTIKYASANYQVQEVCGFLRSLGVGIEGIGTTTLIVTGKKDIEVDIEYTVAEDPTDAMFFIATSIVTNSNLVIKDAPIEFLEVELDLLEKMGLVYKKGEVRVSENGITKIADLSVMASNLTAFPEKIHARPYPGLNIDNLPFFAVIATQAEGVTFIHDWVYEKRAIYYTELDKFGADTTLLDQHRISITGRKSLKGAEIICPPALRPATILLIAALGARGPSTLRNVYSINRGYEDLIARLTQIGAVIKATDK